MRGLGWALLAILTVGDARADLDAADYVGKTQALPAGRSREQIGRDIARAVEEQARQERREAEEEALRRARAEAEAARRPYPQRLLDERCTACHPADYYANQRHTSIGWHLVILRMRALNRAPVTLAEQVVLAGELTRVRPATGTGALAEHGLGAGVLALSVAAPWWIGRRWRRRARQRA